jgi:hypothetical protein
MNDAEVRWLAGKPSGAIAMSDFYGKSVWPTSVEYLVIAGGGGGGGCARAAGSSAGGGAGGFRGYIKRYI